MQSRIAEAIRLKTNPVALLWADEAPEGALQFKPGRWGCVMAMIATVAAKGKVGAAGRQTYGCWGGGVGLGFGNAYQTFPGGVECFYGFLADGNERSEVGRQIGEGMKQAGAGQMAEDFLLGERYVADAECARRFVDSMPMRDIPAQYVIAKPLEQISASDEVKTLTFFVEPDALSALTILANYTHPERENVAMPWGAGCQVMGVFAYREMESAQPRALVGLTDISARRSVRGSLGANVLSFTVPWPMFLEMEAHAPASFLQRETWASLQPKS